MSWSTGIFKVEIICGSEGSRIQKLLKDDLNEKGTLDDGVIYLDIDPGCASKATFDSLVDFGKKHKLTMWIDVEEDEDAFGSTSCFEISYGELRGR